MENPLLVALSRQMTLQRDLDVTANNIANLNTSGYKADGSLFEEYAMAAASDGRFQGADRRVSFVVDRATWTDYSGGAIQQTGNPLDVAIDGDGFLAVQTPRGERYTRAGAMQINAGGELVTADGSRVLGNGGPIVLQPGDNNINIARDGTISTNRGERGKLRLVEFAQRNRLRKDGATTFTAADGATAQPATRTTLVQGAIEKSNVQGVIEMTRMIDATRSYSLISQMAQGQGDLRRTAIQRLADVPA